MGVLYMPILKGRSGEFEALAHLARSTASSLLPLIEAVPKSGTPELDIAGFVHKLRTDWPLGEAVAVDLNYPGADGQPARWEQLLKDARRYQVKVRPTVHFADDAPVLEVLRAAIATDRRGCCLRVDASELDENPRDLAIWGTDLMADLLVEPEEVDLVLDFGMLGDDRVVAHAAERAIEHLEGLPWLDRWRSVVVAGGAFPKDLTNVHPWVLTSLRRREVDLWAGLASRRQFFGRQPIFGDYGVGHPPHTPSAPATPSPNIRYAVDGHWMVLRGTKKDPRGNEQYREICRAVSESPEFGGADLSWGDAIITKVVAEEVGPGNPQKWRAYGTSHHLEYVTSRLASLGAP
ncbi:beta family protein [Amycolatopsis sp. w19]|uniref:beta family protein n=1 Tax=Amycolatopsis sp. w19 TaxID=3448134 RepID=UPI003F1C5B60